jgi:type IV pilus assembly protein PilC
MPRLIYTAPMNNNVPIPNPISNQSFDLETQPEIILDLQYDEGTRSKKSGSTPTTKNMLDIFKQVDQWLIEHSAIKFKEKLLFFQLLVTVNDAGISIPEALKLIQEQTKNPRLKLVIIELQKRMNNGLSLADSLRVFPGVFDQTTCSIVEAGESSGQLGPLLKELVNQYERMNVIQKKAKAVMIYPMVIIIVMALLVVIVLLVIVPKLEAIFGGGENLPLPTRILISGSDIVQNYWYFLLGGLFLVVGSFKYWVKSQTGKEQFSTLLLHVPVIGDFMKQMVLSRVTRILGFLIQSGVSIMRSMKIAASVAENPVYEKRILLAADDLSRGIEISENFADDESIFPSMFVQMISIGEKTSSLGNIMNKLADYYDEELERKVGMLSKLMEPIIMMFMAVGAVFMILAIYLPIMQMNDQLI